MIVVAIIALSGVVLALLYTAINGFPTVNLSFLVAIRHYLPYITGGIRFFNSFTHAEIIMPLVGVAIGLRAAYTGYKIVMWVVKKIPMFGVSD